MKIFIAVVILILIIFFVWDLVTRKYLNPYKLWMVFGKKGAGKTTYLTKRAIKALLEGRTVYSNIVIPGTVYIDPNDIGKKDLKPNSLLLLDECGLLFDNRQYKSFQRNWLEFYKMMRHYKVECVLFSQSFDIDKKLRDLTDVMLYLKNVGRVWCVARRIEKNFAINNNASGGQEGAANQLGENYAFSPMLASNALEITWIPRWIPFFNSFETEEHEEMEGVYVPMSWKQELLMYDKNFRIWFVNKNVKGAKRKLLNAFRRLRLPVRRGRTTEISD